MAENKKWGETVMGWFIVNDEDQPSSDANADLSADELIAKYANQTPSTPLTAESAEDSATAPTNAENFVPPNYGTTPPLQNGQVDFDAVYETGGVDAEERERIVKAKSLLDSLPASTDVAVKKQIVGASLNAFGVPIEKIIEAGVAEIQALEFYIRSGATDTEKLLKESSERIQSYEQEIQTLRKIMEERVKEQNIATAACNAKKLEVQTVLEFFGKDAVAQVVKDSPKLHEPSGTAAS